MANSKTYPAGKRGLAPSHPGRMWRDIITGGLGLTLKDAAERMGVSRQQLHRIVSADAPHPVTPNLALRFARLCDKAPEDAEIWLRIQTAYDLWHAREELKPALRAVRPVTARQQKKIAEMA